MNSNGNIAVHLPVLDGKKNWDRWVKQMKVIFGFQDVLEIVSNGFEPLPENPTDVQRNTHREAKKKDCKALFYIHQCVDNKVINLNLLRMELNVPQRIKGRKIKERYNVIVVKNMGIMLLNAGSTKIERERTKSKKLMWPKKIHILMLIQSC
jgi:hypothetical protein